MTTAASRRCLGCGSVHPCDGEPICPECLRTLEHVCYGKQRQTYTLARMISARREPGGPDIHYECPVCRGWHNGRDSYLGRVTYANAVLIGLALYRTDLTYLRNLGWAWSPPRANRLKWRARVSPHHNQEEVPA